MSAFTNLDRIADVLRDNLGDPLRAIASNEGAVVGLDGKERRAVAEMTDGEISFFLAGLRTLATLLAAWIVEKDEGGLVSAELYESVDEEIAGAAGECAQRRGREKEGQFGEKLASIRRARVEFQNAWQTVMCSPDPEALRRLSEQCNHWRKVEATALRDWLLSLGRMNPEAWDASKRVVAELSSLERLCVQINKAHLSDHFSRTDPLLNWHL